MMSSWLTKNKKERRTKVRHKNQYNFQKYKCLENNKIYWPYMKQYFEAAKNQHNQERICQFLEELSTKKIDLGTHARKHPNNTSNWSYLYNIQLETVIYITTNKSDSCFNLKLSSWNPTGVITNVIFSYK